MISSIWRRLSSAKNRQGERGKVPLKFIGEYVRFDDLIPGDMPEDYDIDE